MVFGEPPQKLRAFVAKQFITNLGPVVQSIISLTTSLRRHFVKYMLTILSNPLLFFVEKIVRIFCSAKDSHIFKQKITVDLQYSSLKF